MREPSRAKRMALMALTLGLLALAARTLQPSRSSAATVIARGAGAAFRAEATVVLGRQLGELHGQAFRLIVYASEMGPRYTVISPDGIVLAENLGDEDVARDFPGLQIETMTADYPDDAPLGSPDW